MKTTGEFKETEKGFRWVEVHEYELTDTGSIYLMRRPADDELHMVYKLQKFGDVFRWCGLWNTCVYVRVRLHNLSRAQDFTSIEEAIKAAIQDNCEVKRTTFSEAFKHFNFKYL